MDDEKQKEFKEFIETANKEKVRKLLSQANERESLSKLNQLIEKVYDEPT